MESDIVSTIDCVWYRVDTPAAVFLCPCVLYPYYLASIRGIEVYGICLAKCHATYCLSTFGLAGTLYWKRGHWDCCNTMGQINSSHTLSNIFGKANNWWRKHWTCLVFTCWDCICSTVGNLSTMVSLYAVSCSQHSYRGNGELEKRWKLKRPSSTTYS